MGLVPLLCVVVLCVRGNFYLLLIRSYLLHRVTCVIKQEYLIKPSMSLSCFIVCIYYLFTRLLEVDVLLINDLVITIN
jgi:hypothetical protein